MINNVIADNVITLPTIAEQQKRQKKGIEREENQICENSCTRNRKRKSVDGPIVMMMPFLF